MPMRTSRGWPLINSLAARWAAISRVGLTSLARMLPETSMARITVARCEASVTTAAGRAMARIISVSATRNRAGGIWRRIEGPAPIASLTMLRLA